MLMLGASSAQAQKLVVKEGEIDCGKVEYFKPATATFKIKNKGSKHMRIDDVRVSCGCLKADYPKDEIAGGGEPRRRHLVNVEDGRDSLLRRC